MARGHLPGGYTEIVVGIGRELLAELDAARKARGWSRSEAIRRAIRLLVEADEVPDDEVEHEDHAHTGVLMPHPPKQMAGDRWVGRFRITWSDEQVVAALRECVPGGPCVLHRSREYVLAYVQPALPKGWRAAPWEVVYG